MKYISKLAILLRTISLAIILSTILLILIPNLIGVKTSIDYIGTMEPKIKRGSMSYVSKYSKINTAKKKDIVGVKYKNQEFTSRVVKINEDKTIVVKGDSENDNEALTITSKEYIGKVLLTVPYIGKVLLYLQNNFIVTTLLIFFMILSLAFELVCDEENNYRLENTIVRMMRIKEEEAKKEKKTKKEKTKKEKKEKNKKAKEEKPKKEKETKQEPIEEKKEEKVEVLEEKDIDKKEKEEKKKEQTKKIKVDKKEDKKQKENDTFNKPVILEAETIEFTSLEDNKGKKDDKEDDEPVILEFEEVEDETPEEFIELLEEAEEELEKTQTIKQIKEMYEEDESDK